MSEGELNVAGVANKMLESMVIAPPKSSLSFHSSMISVDIAGASPSPNVRFRDLKARFSKSACWCKMAEFRVKSPKCCDAEHCSQRLSLPALP